MKDKNILFGLISMYLFIEFFVYGLLHVLFVAASLKVFGFLLAGAVIIGTVEYIRLDL